MTVEFNFKLNDVDASNLISILHDAQMDAKRKSGDYLLSYANTKSRVDLANGDWYNGHAEYLEGLKQKVLAGNKRVDA